MAEPSPAPARSPAASRGPTARPCRRPSDPVDEPEINRRLRAQYAEISQLAGGLAHEIRNPLSTLSLNLDLLAEDFQDAETPRDRRVLQKIERLRRESQRLQDILENFLRFARVQDLKLDADRPERRRRRAPRLLRAPGVDAGDRRPHPLRPATCRRSPLDADLFKQALLEPDPQRRARHARRRRADPDDPPRGPLGRPRRDRHRRRA